MNQVTQLYYVSLMNITESGDSVVGTGAPAPLPGTYSQPCPLLPDPPGSWSSLAPALHLPGPQAGPAPPSCPLPLWSWSSMAPSPTCLVPKPALPPPSCPLSPVLVLYGSCPPPAWSPSRPFSLLPAPHLRSWSSMAPVPYLPGPQPALPPPSCPPRQPHPCSGSWSSAAPPDPPP